MASKAPPSPSTPPGVPSSGNAKYAVIAVLLLGGVGAVVAWKMGQKPPEPQVVYADAAPPPPKSTGRNLDDEVPLPPPVEDAGEEKKPVGTVKATSQCDVKSCNGGSTPELEKALAFRASQARRCYNNALAQDSTLQGKVVVSVRIASDGHVCSSNVASNEMGSQSVAACAAGSFRGINFPAPKGGCVDVNVPLKFSPSGQ